MNKRSVSPRYPRIGHGSEQAKHAFRAGRGKGFLFLVLLGMFFVVFVLPSMKKEKPTSPSGPNGGILIPEQGPINDGRIGSNQNGQNGDWSTEDVAFPKSVEKATPNTLPPSGRIELPGLPIDGRTPSFNPNPDASASAPTGPSKTTNKDWSVDTDPNLKSGDGGDGGFKFEPIQRTKPSKTTKGNWSIEE